MNYEILFYDKVAFTIQHVHNQVIIRDIRHSLPPQIIDNVSKVWSNVDRHCIVIELCETPTQINNKDNKRRYLFFDIALGQVEFETPSPLVEFYGDRVTHLVTHPYYEPVGKCEKGEIIIFHEWVYFTPPKVRERAQDLAVLAHSIHDIYKRFYQFEFEDWTPVTLIGKTNPDCASQYYRNNLLMNENMFVQPSANGVSLIGL